MGSYVTTAMIVFYSRFFTCSNPLPWNPLRSPSTDSLHVQIPFLGTPLAPLQLTCSDPLPWNPLSSPSTDSLHVQIPFLGTPLAPLKLIIYMSEVPDPRCHGFVKTIVVVIVVIAVIVIILVIVMILLVVIAAVRHQLACMQRGPRDTETHLAPSCVHAAALLSLVCASSLVCCVNAELCLGKQAQ